MKFNNFREKLFELYYLFFGSLIRMKNDNLPHKICVKLKNSICIFFGYSDSFF